MKGSDLKIIDPFETMIRNIYKITDFVERMRVQKAIVDLREFSPDLAKEIKKIDPKMIPLGKETFTAEIDKPYFDTLIDFATWRGAPNGLI